MNEINNLIYTLEINYVNNSGINVSIAIKINDNGSEINSVKVGDVCVTEETISGRVLSGKYENSSEYCGYRYDYQNGKNLLNINPQIPIETVVSLINKKKMETDFLIAKMVLSSISRGDYRVVILNKGNLNVIKTISAENEKLGRYSLQENIDLLKLDGEESFVEQDKKRRYEIGDDIVEESQTTIDGDIKSCLSELSAILSKNPQNYKDLIEIKKQIQDKTMY